MYKILRKVISVFAVAVWANLTPDLTMNHTNLQKSANAVKDLSCMLEVPHFINCCALYKPFLTIL